MHSCCILYFKERESRGRKAVGQASLRESAMLRQQFVSGLRTETHIPTLPSPLDHTQTHTQVCGVCTCERILSAGPSFSPMVLSRCSSVSSGKVSPSMACSRNTWRRHRRFSHSPGIRTETHSTHKPTRSFTQPTKQWFYSKMLHTYFKREKYLTFNIFTIQSIQLWRNCCLTASLAAFYLSLFISFY